MSANPRATVHPRGLSPRLLAASQALDAANAAGGDRPLEDIDAHCWPHSSAMNSGEIERFGQRKKRFAACGMTRVESDRLADQLLLRDREGDDRRLCFECAHLEEQKGGEWFCTNALAAGVSVKAKALELPLALMFQQQRCPGFRA